MATLRANDHAYRSRGQSLEGEPVKHSNRDRFLNIFKSRSRSRSPAPSSDQGNPENSSGHGEPASSVSPATQREPGFLGHPQESLPVAGKHDSGSSSTEWRGGDAEGLDLSDSAYRKAWLTFSADQQQQLSDKDSIIILFQNLVQVDKEHQDKSFVRKGLKLLSPWLGRLKTTIDFVSPFVSVEPAAGTALGLIKGAASVAIAICGAADELTSDISSLFERLPAIERCAQATKDGFKMPNIFEVLVNVYGDLLHFYLVTIAVFKKYGFEVQLVMSMLEPRIPAIVSSFKSHYELLGESVQAEIFGSVQDIKDELIDAMIRDNLDMKRDAENRYYNELQQRHNGACSWITSNEDFIYWMLNSGDLNTLAMLGDMGCGKTMTTAYVVDHLSRSHLVCSYYCKDDEMTTNLGNIYRSLMSQLLAREPRLKKSFRDWYEKEKPRIPVKPTESNPAMRSFLQQCISKSEDWVFIVVDGLDECDISSQRQLLLLFKDLHQSQARLKVFLSSRYGKNIESALPSGAGRLDFQHSDGRDHAIAGYLAYNSGLPENIRDQVVNRLSQMARGSAIWIRIALEFISKHLPEDDTELNEIMDQIPSAGDLAGLYQKLFVKACSNLPKIKARLQCALETLAVARRPLTIEELACAVSTDLSKSQHGHISELEKVARSVNYLELVRPFVTFIGKNTKTSQIRLVHQSLKELLLQASPSAWDKVSETWQFEQTLKRSAQLNGLLLQRCIKYLLLPECGDRDLLSYFENRGQSHVRALEFLAIGDVFDTNDSDEAGDDVLEQGAYYNPSDMGYGGFFAYAASQWTWHWLDASPDLRPSADDLITLCSYGSQRLENWSQQWRRPNCTFVPERSLPQDDPKLDPLIVASRFGTVPSITDLLKRDLSSPDFLPQSVWIAVDSLISQESVSVIKGLLVDKSLGSVICCTPFFDEVFRHWERLRQSADTVDEWGDVFDILINELHDDLLRDGNDLLCRAAGAGCLPLIEKLFRVTRSDPAVRKAILAVDRLHKHGRGSTLSAHQSIGEAAYEGHADVVRFLCRQPGIEPHLYFRNEHGHTVFHQAARRFSSTETFRVLIERWPGGVNVRNNDHDTALVQLVFNCTNSDSVAIESARLLLTEGGADATGAGDDPGYSPLCTAVRSGNVAMCRLLITQGTASPWTVVTVAERSGRPCFTKDVDTLRRNREEVLAGLCSLMPLAVSTEFLIWFAQ